MGEIREQKLEVQKGEDRREGRKESSNYQRHPRTRTKQQPNTNVRRNN